MAQTDACTKTIDGVEYTVYKLDPRVSYRLSRRLGAVLAPTLGAAIGKANMGSLEDSSLDLDKAGREFFDRLDEKLLDDLVQTFGEVSFVGGKKVVDIFAMHFRGKVGTMFEWLAFCLASEYADVVKKTREGIGRVGLLVRPKSESPST